MEALLELEWEVLSHSAYSLDIAPSDYHLFRLMRQGLWRFSNAEDVRNWVIQWIASKDDSFFQCGIRILLERWEKVIENDGEYFD